MKRHCYISLEDPFLYHGLTRAIAFIKPSVKYEGKTLQKRRNKREVKKYAVYLYGLCLGRKWPHFGKIGLYSSNLNITDKPPKGRLYKWLFRNKLIE